MRRSLLLLALGFVTGACGSDTATRAPAASTTTAPVSAASATSQRLAFTTKDGTKIDYVLLVAADRQVGQPGKVLFAFPPGGQDLDLAQRIVDERWGSEALARGWVVVSPAAPPTGLFYSDPSAHLVPELLDAVAVQYPPEGGRFDLGGVSNGGLSAFKAALSYPERFRSLVVFPGYSEGGGDDPKLSALKDIGVSMFVGGNDSGWLESSQQTEATLKGLGYTVELHVVPGEGHIISSLTGAELFDAIERVRA
jgi:dipeptidyl aminopeptidase/acylaminoacyl peptidase